MNRRGARRAIVVGLGLALVAAPAAAQDLPVVKGKKVVAVVQGEPITLDEFNQRLVAGGGQPGATGPAELALLDRMINVTLVAQEARRMGLDRLPELRKMVDAQARLMLREELVERTVKDLKADPRAVEETYRASVREWKVSAALFDLEEPARAFEAEVRAGKDFIETARAFLAQGRARQTQEGVVLRRETVDPPIAEALAGLAVGATSPVVAGRSGLVVVRLEELRYPENPEKRAEAERIVLTARRKEAVAALDEALRKKYVKLDRALLDSLDYGSETPGIEALSKDRRVLAEIKGEPPVTVADLTEELRFQFYHGMKMAAERGRLNARKQQALDGILHRKLFRKEALRLKLDRTEAYRSKVRDYENSVLFDMAVRRAVAPDVKLTEADLTTYYEAHRAEYTSPEMLRLRSLVFADARSAESAHAALQKGADFQWVADRTEGQLPRNTAGVIVFDGRPIMTSQLPEDVRKAVAGARAGDVRRHADAAGRVHVLVVQDVVPATPRPFEQVRGEIATKVANEKIEKAVEEYAARLRSLSAVKVYLRAS